MSNEQLKTRDTSHASRFTPHASRLAGYATTTQVIVLTIIAVGFGLRLHTLASESLWYDELLQLDIAQGPLLEIFPRLRGHSGVPLDYLISHFWLLLGRGDGWVRLPTVMVGTLSLPLVYQLGWIMLGRNVGLLLMILLALSPFHVRYSQEVRPYALVVLGVTLAVYAFWKLRQTERWQYFVPLQIGVLIFSLAHIFAVVIFIPLSIFVAIDFVFAQNKKWVLKTFGALVLTGVLPLLVFLAMGWGDVLFYTSREFGSALVQPDSSVTAANNNQEISAEKDIQVNLSFVREKFLTPFAGHNIVGAYILIYGLAGLGLIDLLVQNKFKLVLLLFLWVLLPPVIIILFLIYRQTFFVPRYVISILPAHLMLLSVGILVLPRWLKRLTSRRVAEESVQDFRTDRGARGESPRIPPGLSRFPKILDAPVAEIGLLILSAAVFINFILGLSRDYWQVNKENWHLVGDFIAANAGPNDAVIALRAESTMNWYYPPASTLPNYYWDLETVQKTVAGAERSWVILSIFSSRADGKVKAWLSEQQAIGFELDPAIKVHYLGNNVPPNQLLQEIQGFALPVDHTLYASLARENHRHRPEVARQYYQLAIEYAPDEKIRAEYRAAMETLP